jgi:hypothetical protein
LAALKLLSIAGPARWLFSFENPADINAHKSKRFASEKRDDDSVIDLPNWRRGNGTVVN